jgi:hypothetical protein
MAGKYDIRVLTKAVRQIIVPGQHFLSTFFSASAPEYHNSRLVEVHIFRDGRKMAAFVEPIHAANVSERSGFTAGTVKIPYIKEKRPLRAGDLTRIQPGQHVYDAVDPATQADRLLGEDLRQLKAMIARREEWMAAQAIIKGQVTVKGEGIDATITFPTLASHRPNLSGTDLWGDAASDPIEQLREFARLNSKDSGAESTDVFLGSAAVDAFLANAKVKAYFDIRNYALGQVAVARESAAPGAKIKIAHVEGVDIWEIRDWYTDPDTGLDVPMVPANALIMGSRFLDNRRHYGLIEDMDAITEQAVTARTDFYAKSWVEKDPSVRWLMVQSAPLPIPHQIDGFVVVEDVLA